MSDTAKGKISAMEKAITPSNVIEKGTSKRGRKPGVKTAAATPNDALTVASKATREVVPTEPFKQPFDEIFKEHTTDLGTTNSQKAPTTPKKTTKATSTTPAKPFELSVPVTFEEEDLRLTRQLGRILLEQLPVQNIAEFYDWIHSPIVQPQWEEFVADYFEYNIFAEEPDKRDVVETAERVIRFGKGKYLIYKPCKDDWTQEDHCIRFVVTVANNQMAQWGNVWPDIWKQHGWEITKALFEMLMYLRHTAKLKVQAKMSMFAKSSKKRNVES